MFLSPDNDNTHDRKYFSEMVNCFGQDVKGHNPTIIIIIIIITMTLLLTFVLNENV